MTNYSKIMKPLFKKFWPIYGQAVSLKKVRVFFASAVIFFPCSIQAEPINQSKMDSVLVNSSSVFEEFPFIYDTIDDFSLMEQKILKFVPAKISDDLRVDSFSEPFGCFNSSVDLVVPIRNESAKGDSENGCRYCPEMFNEKVCEAIHAWFFFGYFAMAYYLYTQRPR